MNHNSIKKLDPQAVFVNGLVFLLPFSTLIGAGGGVSVCSFIFLLAGLFLWKRGRLALTQHLGEIRWVLIAFLLNFLYVLANLLLRSHETLGTLEKPSRMLFAVTALVCVLVLRPSRKSLWWGLIAGVFAGAAFIGYQRIALGLVRPGGLMNAITFGDLALCMGLLCLAAVLDFRGGKYVLWPCLGALAGLAASNATGTRGGWLALLAALVVFLKYSHFLRGRAIRAIGAMAAVLMVLTYVVPQTGVQARVMEGVSDVRLYFDGGSIDTNLGQRFELWKGAAVLIGRHPLFGAGILSYKEEMRGEVEAGRLNALVLPREHVHNDALQALVTGGIVGFLIWLATLVAPLLFFLRVLKRHESAGNEEIALGMAGLLLVLSYAAFGLTEVIFWSVKGSLFYILMLYLLMGFCLNAKARRGGV
ncbi:MAG TPA: O-antigen ligase family protein [Janthinobacterium sp.]|jgi:O-antigen ligase|nr:O-antigen ligase family protein [Janthinobacterium sp.]